jgi:NTE family protein
MPEMNENVSSGAGQGLGWNGPAGEAAAPLRSAASALLSAAEIWSPNNSVSAREETPAIIEPENAKTSEAEPADKPVEDAVPRRRLRPSEVLAEARFFSSHGQPPRSNTADVELAHALEQRAAIRLAEAGEQMEQVSQQGTGQAEEVAPTPSTSPLHKLSLALQGGGSFGAFTWGVLERLLEERVSFDAISGASVGAINAALLACGLVQGGHQGAIRLLGTFWQRMINESSFRALMLVGGFSPAGSSVAFAPTLRCGQFDPFDLDPLRDALSRHIDFKALRARDCPKLLIGATRVRDGRQQIFDNAAITADVLLASTCPPLVHCAVEIEGESYWDGGFGANPPLLRLVRDSLVSDILVVQVTPAHDAYVPITAAAIDRRLDQITANAALNAELAALEWAREKGVSAARIHHIAAENEIDGLAQRSPADLGRSFIALLHGRGRSAAQRWLHARLSAKPMLAAQSELVDA